MRPDNAQTMHSTLLASKTTMRQCLLVLFGALTLAIAAQISIPWAPVPLTFQSATALLIALLYGSRLATTTVVLYLMAGLAGLPVFADFSFGPLALLGPTGGYLLGFVPAAFLTGYLVERGFSKTLLGAFFAACLGALVLFTAGVLMLAGFVGIHKAYLFGLKPFLLTEPIKLFAVALITPRFWRQND